MNYLEGILTIIFSFIIIKYLFKKEHFGGIMGKSDSASEKKNCDKEVEKLKNELKSKYSSLKYKKKEKKCATSGVYSATKGECCVNHANCQSRYCDRKEGDSTGLCIYDFPRKSGQPCSFHEDCSGYGPGTTQMACCDGTCKRKSKKGPLDTFGSCP